MKALLALLAIALIAVFVVWRQPDDRGTTGDRGTGSSSGGSLGGRCTVFADTPFVDRGGTVTATGRYRCGKSDGGVDTTVYLQLNSGTAGWANLDRQPMAATGADTTRKRPAKDRAVRASAPCTPGSYRTVVGGTVSNGDHGYKVQAISKPATLACPAAS